MASFVHVLTLCTHQTNTSISLLLNNLVNTSLEVFYKKKSEVMKHSKKCLPCFLCWQIRWKDQEPGIAHHLSNWK